ncbi:MAG: ATP-binding cassette domain-containing protein [Cytophagales bacterium]|nr:ATP-binding cassette domain-containing protein [Cytophagales bacterium]
MARGRKDDIPEEDKKRKITGQSFRESLKIFRFVTPYRAYFILGLVFLGLSALTSLAFPVLAGELINAAVGKSQFTINQVGLGLLASLLLQALFSFFRVELFARVSENTLRDIRSALYGKIITLPTQYLESKRVGELISRLTADVSQLQDVISFSLAEFLRQTLTLIVGITIVVIRSPQLTLFMLGTFPVIMGAAMFFGRYIRKLSKITQDQLAKTNVIVEETLQASNVVKAFTNETYEVKRYDNALQQVMGTALKTARLRGGFTSFIIVALFGAIFGILWYGTTLLASGVIREGELFEFILYTVFIGGAMGGMGDLYAQLQKTIGASERVRDILTESSEVLLDEEVKPVRIYGDVAFQNVSFAYPGRPDVPVLKGIDFRMEAGQKIALVGHSGAGKSTIVQLLMRYHTPSLGRVLVDGQDVQAYEVRQLRRNIGVVPQDVTLFGGSIGENIAYGKPGATEAEIREAARKANALEFIDTFPEGLDTVVGERGVKLSGGQRQRIAIARAILKDPAILILDEATSSLDAESEKLVQEALDELMKGRTTIIIAHRLATIRKVDYIYVISEGRILEAGTHEQLADLENGLYQHLLKLQFELE